MYLALYRKYRPKTFDDVISQEHITTTLKNQLKNGQPSHAYLFTGSRGTGKTTCAKILAKALNCTDLKDGNPCLECENCLNIDDNTPDVMEIDAASNSGVDSVRNLKDESVYSPISCKYRVYIIDEVHMLSTAAFNALLKLIEEPPPHVIFIFATTEIHKIPATIVSRCQRFEFRRIDINDSKKRIISIAEKENKTITDDAAFLISKISDGGMRDALSLLDQCFSVTDNVTADTVRECAGISGSDYLFKIADYIYNHDTASSIKILDDLIGKSKDIIRLCEELISHYRSLMLIKAGADNSIIRAVAEDIENYKIQCSKYSLEQIMRCISILSDTLTSMNRVRTPSLIFEMCLIKLCTPKLDTNEKALSLRIDSLEKMLLDTIEKLKSGEIKTNALTPAENTEIQNNQVYTEEKTIYEKVSENEQDAYPVMNESVVPFEPAASYPSEPFSPQPPVSSEQKNTVSVQNNDNLNAFKPFNEWKEIINTLPFSIKIIIEDTTAEINGNTVRVSGSSISIECIMKDFKQEVVNAVSKAIGRKVIIISSETIITEEEKENKVKNFLDFAKSQGVNIKISK